MEYETLLFLTVIAGLTRNLLSIREIPLAQEMADVPPP